jgi:hypothetical protein
MEAYSGVEKRSGRDRRKQPLSIVKNIFHGGLRSSSRRAEDRRGITIFDRYSTSLFISIMIVLSLSLLDALLTLILLSRGATELNPVMDYYLRHGPEVFLIVKYGLTAFSIFLIFLLNDVLKARYGLGTGTVLHLFAAVFGSVVVWQLYLLSV